MNDSLVRRAALLAATALAAGLAWVASASAAPVDVQVVDRETGQALQVWRHDGRLFVAGAPGDRYGLEVTNHTDRRVLVVMSVDGVNILTGETAGYDQRGYIFDAHESYELDGWRKSMSEVADFTFTRLPKSYAALTGRPGNVGVIGIAVFDEAAPVVAETPPPVEDAQNAPPPPAPLPAGARRPGGVDRDSGGMAGDFVAGKAAPQTSAPAITAYTSRSREMAGNDSSSRAAAAEPRDEKLGTGHGDREYSSLTIVPFERASSRPEYTQEIAYDTYDNLAAIGVIPTWRYGERRPQPFPSSPDGEGFVPDPPGRP